MAVALPDEAELRKVFSLRTIAWLRQIAEIAEIRSIAEEADDLGGFGAFPVHDVVAQDDLAAMLAFSAEQRRQDVYLFSPVEPGNIVAGSGLTGGGNGGNNVTLAVGAGTGITVNADDIALTVPTASGTYTPTLTNTTNLDGSTAYACQYLRVGSVVMVSGRVDINPTAANTLTTLGISLPVASNFANANECGGTAATADDITDKAAAIFADATNDRATLQFKCGATTSAYNLFFQFSYRII